LHAPTGRCAPSELGLYIGIERINQASKELVKFIIFLCESRAAQKIIAAAYLNDLAKNSRLSITADLNYRVLVTTYTKKSDRPPTSPPNVLIELCHRELQIYRL